jgi:hypothetical protein
MPLLKVRVALVIAFTLGMTAMYLLDRVGDPAPCAPCPRYAPVAVQRVENA